MPQQNPMDQDMQRCIESCQDCHNICLQTAMTVCLEAGDTHTQPEHFRLMVNCAEICQTAANFMLSASALHPQICDVCADTCDACAQSCTEIGNMDDCVQACQQCADNCRQMAQSSHRMETGISSSTGAMPRQPH